MSTRATIAFMPYAPIEDSFEMGSYEVWPYYREKEKRLSDERVISFLDRLFSRYVQWQSNREDGPHEVPSDTITIIQPKGLKIGFEEYSETQIEDVRYIVYILAFSALNESVMITHSSDAFEYYIQNIDVEKDGIFLYSQYFASIDLVKFMKPYTVLTIFNKFHKQNLCDALGETLDKKDNPQIRRIFRCLEFYYYCASYSDRISLEQRIISLVMSFEVLLGFKNKKKFADKIDQYFSKDFAYVEARDITRDRITKNYKRSITTWWAYDLYDLRSNIVHGNMFDWEHEKYGGVFTRIDFGGELLRRLIKLILAEHSCFEYDYGQMILEAESIDKELLKRVEDYKDLFISNGR